MVRKVEEIKKVAVIGSGTMGKGITQVFVEKNFKVTLIDKNKEILEKAISDISANLRVKAKEGMIREAEAEQAISRVSVSADFEDAGSADFILEVVFEDLNVKKGVFEALENVCGPDRILATNTSGISITAIAGAVKNPERVIGMHWWNPAYIIPVIEVIKGEKTSGEVMETVRELVLALGKKPVMVLKDIPGFLGNRMQYALMREAIYLLEQGVASAEDIDTMVKAGFGFKFPILGPLETIDMAGMDIYSKVGSYLYGKLCNDTILPQLVKDYAGSNRLGLKTKKGFYDYTNCDLAELGRNRTKQLEALLKLTGY